MEKFKYVDNRYESINRVMGKIFALQAKLNKDFNGEDWLSTGISKRTNKNVAMGCATMDEAIELMNNIPWKHWDGKTEINWDNMVTECIDILHFIPSIVEDVYGANGYITTPMSLCNLSYIIPMSEDMHCIELEHTIRYNNDLTVEEHIIILSSLCSIVGTTYNLHKHVSKNYGKLIKDIQACLDYLFMFLEVNFDLTAEDIFKKYLIKNTLNRFRKNNGYADGTYNKIWNGTEDNDYIFTLVKDMDVEDQDAMYDVMDKAYKSIFSL